MDANDIKILVRLGLTTAIIVISSIVLMGGYDATGSHVNALCWAIIAFCFSLFFCYACILGVKSLFSIKKKNKSTVKNETAQNVPTQLPDKNGNENCVNAIPSDDLTTADIDKGKDFNNSKNDPNQGITEESLVAKGYGINKVKIRNKEHTIYDYIMMKERKFYILHIFHEHLHNLEGSDLAADLAAFYEFGLMKKIPRKMLEAELGEIINKGNYSTATNNIDVDKKIKFRRVLKIYGFSDPNDKNGSSH